jgi:hypothetical protein
MDCIRTSPPSNTYTPWHTHRHTCTHCIRKRFCNAGVLNARFSVTVEQCTQNTLKLNVTDAVDNGIIYIQGEGVACKQTTQAGTSITHEWNFASCGISWVNMLMIYNVITKIVCKTHCPLHLAVFPG